MSGTTEIRSALLTHVTAASPGCAISAASVSWENKGFIPAPKTRWYRATFLPGQQVAAAIGTAAANRNVGVLQLDVIDAKNTGDVSAQAEAERIAACFKRGTVLTYSGVNVRCERAYRGPAVQYEDWFFIPVLVEYRADVAN